MIKKYKKKKVYVKGKRIGRPLFDSFFTFGMSIFESCLLGTILYDINGQPNIFPREFFEKIKNPPYDFSLDLYIYYMSKKFRLKNIRYSVDFKNRMYGQ